MFLFLGEDCGFSCRYWNGMACKEGCVCFSKISKEHTLTAYNSHDWDRRGLYFYITVYCMGILHRELS